jgi:hypothetical protein
MKRLVNHKFNVRDMLYPLFYVTPFFSVSTLELKLSVLCMIIMPLDKARRSQKKGTEDLHSWHMWQLFCIYLNSHFSMEYFQDIIY